MIYFCLGQINDLAVNPDNLKNSDLYRYTGNTPVTEKQWCFVIAHLLLRRFLWPEQLCVQQQHCSLLQHLDETEAESGAAVAHLGAV